MKIRVIIPFVICVIMTIGSAGAVWGNSSILTLNAPILTSDPYKQLSRMDQITSDLYRAAYTNNRQAGHIYIQQLLGMMDGDLTFSAGKRAGWLAIEKDAKYIRETLWNGAASSRWLDEAARIRLASDALIRPEQALWLQYKQLMLDDLSRIEKAWRIQTGDGSIAARAAMNLLQEHAQRIEPAIEMMYGSMHGAELKERIRYTNLLLESGNASAQYKTRVDHSLEALNQAVIRLYEQSGRVNAAVPVITPMTAAHPLSWTFFLGTIISAVLTYSGWRKYKAKPYGIKPLT